jgi:hypothetical protein
LLPTTFLIECVYSKKMINSKKIAEIISGIISPLGIAFFVTIIFSLYSPITPENYNIYFSIILGMFFLCIFPVIAILYFYKKGTVDIWVSDRKIRTPFYIFAIIGYIIGSITFFQLNYEIMFVLTIAYIFVTTVVMFVNFITKVSSHTAGIAGPMTALTFVFGLIALPLFVIIPIAMWARIKLKAHNYQQLTSGIIISVIVTSIVYIILYL